MRKNFFLTTAEVVQLYQTSDFRIVIWGTGIPAQDVFHTMRHAGIPILAWGDNNPQKQGTHLLGMPVYGQEHFPEKERLLVLVACWMSFGAIVSSLEKAGFHNFYGLLDSLKYSIEAMEEDCRFLAAVQRPKRRDAVLLEVYGNIGDILVHFGILRYLIQKYGTNAYVLAEGEAFAELIGLLTPHVYAINREKFHEDATYRRILLKKLCAIGFRKSILLSDARIVATRRILNDIIFPIEKIIVSRDLAVGDYLPEMDAANLSMENVPLSAVHSLPFLSEVISKTPFPRYLPSRYVAINMGTSSKVRRYDPRQFSKVVKHILGKKLAVVFIGAGEYDKAFYRKIREECPNDALLVSYISQLSLRESLYVIQNALFFVGTESGMWNASYLLRIPSVVIYGRGDYGSFRHIADFVQYVSVPDRGCMGCCWFCTNPDLEGRPHCISDITPEMVMDKIDEVIVGIENL